MNKNGNALCSVFVYPRPCYQMLVVNTNRNSVSICVHSMPRVQRPSTNTHGHGIAVVVAAVYAADAANALPPDMPPPSVTSPITHPGPCGKPCSLDVGEQVRNSMASVGSAVLTSLRQRRVQFQSCSAEHVMCCMICQGSRTCDRARIREKHTCTPNYVYPQLRVLLVVCSQKVTTYNV